MSLLKLPEIKAFDDLARIEYAPPKEVLARFDPSIKAAVEGDDSIAIYGPIGSAPGEQMENSDKRIAAALRKIGKRDIQVNVNSPGGSLFDGLAIYNLLRSHPARVTVNVLALAGSAASIIAMAGDTVNMAPGSMIMVHNASALVVGNRHDLEETRDTLQMADESMASIYAARTGESLETAVSWMDGKRGNGTFINAQRAIELGLADSELEPDSVRADAHETRNIRSAAQIERALMDSGHSRAEARRIMSDLKNGKPDAATHVKPDADEGASKLMDAFRVFAT